MKRFWFEFKYREGLAMPVGVAFGCGVTAYNYADAISIIQTAIFDGADVPEISRYVEDINIADLDQNHVIPNMHPVIYRGVWYPMGYR